MDINGNMELDNFEVFVNEVTEKDSLSVPSNKITKDMVQKSINNQFNNNRVITNGVNHSMMESILMDLEEYTNDFVRGK